MAIKGRIPVQYNGKVQTFYPKTIAEQVIVNNNTNLLDKLGELESSMNESTIIPDPDVVTDNGLYAIVNSDKMPTTGKYVVESQVIDSDTQYQSAISIENQEKFERWKVDGVWGEWSKHKGASLEHQSVEFREIVSTDTNSLTLPSEIDPDTSQFKIFINSKFISKHHYNIVDDTITFDIQLRENDEVIYLVDIITKSNVDVDDIPLDGDSIASKSIGFKKLKDEMITKHLQGRVNPDDNETLLTPKAAKLLMERNEGHLIATINHKQKRYLTPLAYLYKGGAGAGGAGEVPAGSTNPNSFAIGVELIDKDNIGIYMSEYYTNIGDITLTKASSTVYYITFDNSPYCVMLMLIDDTSQLDGDLLEDIINEQTTIKSDIGNIGNLSTMDRSSLVNAINEIKSKLDMMNTIEDITNNTTYRVEYSVVDNKPQIKYEEV